MTEREDRLIRLVDRLLSDIESLEQQLALERSFNNDIKQIEKEEKVRGVA